MNAFGCEGVIVIPVWADDETTIEGMTRLPVLQGNLEPETIDYILAEAGRVANMNLDKRRIARMENPTPPPVGLTPTFTPMPPPTA